MEWGCLTRGPRFRRLRDFREWTGFDIGLVIVALPCLVFGLWGVTTLEATLGDMADLARQCGQGECEHHGVLVDHAVGLIGLGNTYRPGGSTNYCVLTMRLDNGTWQAAVNGSYCTGVANGSPVDAEIWRSQVVRVRSPRGEIGTYLNPAVGIPVGLARLLAFFPVALIIAMIHFDVVNRHVVPRLRRRPPPSPHRRHDAC